MPSPNSPLVVVAMSGGVDSSVAAAMLLEMGYSVIGVMLRLWSEPGNEAYNRCCTPDSMAQARRVASMLGFPFYTLDAKEKFREQVVQYFIDGYAQGVTPNPCLVCNRQVRWSYLYDYAQALGADFLATGHYACIKGDKERGYQLLRGIDSLKDQSYILHFLSQEQLSHTLLPLGALTKAEVRDLARNHQLPVSEKPDSQDLCFLGNGDYRQFLTRNAPHVNSSGPIVDIEGRILGRHKGLANFTIGQRKGLGISAHQPLYVLEKDISTNAIIVGEKNKLGNNNFKAGPVNWISGIAPVRTFRSLVKTRYTASLEKATIKLIENDMVSVHFDAPQRDITPGQSAVFYDQEVCLGGGIIQRLVRE